MDDAPPPPCPGRHAVEDALLSRRSVRAFLPRPVPTDLLARLLVLAARAPSNSNTQPWHVHVLTGEPKQRLGEAIVHELETNGRTAEPEYPYQPTDWPEPFLSRRREFGRSLYLDQLGIDPADLAARHAHHIRNYGFFGAPVGLVLTVSRHARAGALIDAGLFLQGLAIAARAHGLDTCFQASFIDFHPVIRRHLGVAEDRLVVCGVSLGYADRAHRLDTLRTGREPLSAFVTFHGDERTLQPLPEPAMDHRQQLIDRSIPFLREVRNKTPGKELEAWLNATHGPGSALYGDLSRLITLGVAEGWAANEEVGGPRYRRSRLLDPRPETSFFSITAVYMDSTHPQAFPDGDAGDVLQGDFHGHPYGELNLVVPLDPGAQLMGLQGWQGAGWTAPDPGSAHYPEVKGGRLIALFYLPAGRISYDVEPTSPRRGR